MVRTGHLVDGRIFYGHLESSQGNRIEDEVSFRDGKFRSRYLLQHGYTEVDYEVFAEKDASEAERHVFEVSVPKRGDNEHININGSIEGDEIYLAMTIVKLESPVGHLKFYGESHQLRPDTAPLGLAS
jgi:hypothetical protein